MYVRSILVDLSSFVNATIVCFVVILAQIPIWLLGCFHRGAVYPLISAHIDSEFMIANRLNVTVILTTGRRKCRHLPRTELHRSLHRYAMSLHHKVVVWLAVSRCPTQTVVPNIWCILRMKDWV